MTAPAPLPADLHQFAGAYRTAVTDVMPFLQPERLEGLALHNPAWAPERFDVRGYLDASETRYVTALRTFVKCGGHLEGLRSLDIGGFMGAFPLALQRIGVEVVLSEHYAYYDGAFDELRDFLAAEGVEIWDADLTRPDAAPDQGPFGLVTNMALLKHLAHSPRPVMENMGALLTPDGLLVVEVPNLAYWPKRMAMLTGRTIYPALRDVYTSREPFTGHHREYTEHDLRELLDLAGFQVQALVTFNYTPQAVEPTGPLAVLDLPRRHLRNGRELLLACARLAGKGAFPHPHENVYGSIKRLGWIREAIRPGDRVLEVGCGTGYMITLPLLDAGYDIRGVDLNAEGIAYGREIARTSGLDPERLSTTDVSTMDEAFDAIILSEVLEHQDDAQAADLLLVVRERLKPGGRLLLTVPNGYGWFEVESFLWDGLGLGRIVEALRLDVVARLVICLKLGDYEDAAHPSAVDTSPHLQRFTRRSIQRTVERAGFEVEEVTGSVLAAGPLSHMLFTGAPRWMARNTRLGDRWPSLASGFFVRARRSG